MRGHVLQIMRARVLHRNPLACQRPGRSSRNDLDLPGQILPGQRSRVVHHLLRSSSGDQIAAILTRAGAEIEHVISGANSVFIMLHDQHGVAQIAQVLKRPDQPLIVALMQSDRRLIKHVEHSTQPRTDLRSQPYPLAFAARESRR